MMKDIWYVLKVIFIAPIAGAVKAIKRSLYGEFSSCDQSSVCVPNEASISKANKQLESGSSSSKSENRDCEA